MKSLGIYVHIPFCLKKCNYCDFCSFPVEEKKDEVDTYVDRVCLEIEHSKGVYGNKYYVDTVFFGGGTPTVLGTDQLGRILIAIKKSFKVEEDAEISIEANPETITAKKAENLKFLGFNRLSMGVQSFDDEVLSVLGRVHTASKAKESFGLLRDAGFKNINIDLMLGVPNEPFDIFKRSLEELLELKPEHISFYGLQLEEGTAFYNDYKLGKIDIPSWEENRKMYHFAVDALKSNGFHHYEVSNAAKPGFECKHNIKYWTMKDYLGFGAAAHSFIEGKRFYNTNVLDYHREDENISEDDISLEREGDLIFTGLRLIDGTEFSEEFFNKHIKTIEELVEEGYIERCDRLLRLTSKGLDNTNNVIGRFF